MKYVFLVLGFKVILFWSVLAYSAGDCGFELTDDNLAAIASELGAKALDKHRSDFKPPAPRKSKKIPWTLDNKEDIAEFVEDILRKKEKATRDGSTKLATESKNLSGDRVAWWEANTGTFVVFNPKDGDCGSAYRPEKGKEEYQGAT